MREPKAKTIQVIPDPAKIKKIDVLAGKLHKSRAAFCELALDALIPRLESGEWVVLNGKVMPKAEAAESLAA